MCIPCGKTFVLYQDQGHLSRLRSFVKVTFKRKEWPLDGHWSFSNTSCFLHNFLNLEVSQHLIGKKILKKTNLVQPIRILITFEFRKILANKTKNLLDPLPDDKLLSWPKLKQIAENILRCIQNER